MAELTRKEMKAAIDKAKTVKAYEQPYWRYPKTGDDQKSCPMLQMMFDMEHKGGIIIHIPYEAKGILDAKN